jgi:hypothetical protein
VNETLTTANEYTIEKHQKGVKEWLEYYKEEIKRDNFIIELYNINRYLNDDEFSTMEEARNINRIILECELVIGNCQENLVGLPRG